MFIEVKFLLKGRSNHSLENKQKEKHDAKVLQLRSKCWLLQGCAHRQTQAKEMTQSIQQIQGGCVFCLLQKTRALLEILDIIQNCLLSKAIIHNPPCFLCSKCSLFILHNLPPLSHSFPHLTGGDRS